MDKTLLFPFRFFETCLGFFGLSFFVHFPPPHMGIFPAIYLVGIIPWFPQNIMNILHPFIVPYRSVRRPQCFQCIINKRSVSVKSHFQEECTVESILRGTFCLTNFDLRKESLLEHYCLRHYRFGRISPEMV